MPDVKISALASAAPLTGSELLELVQTVNKRATAQQVAALAHNNAVIAASAALTGTVAIPNAVEQKVDLPIEEFDYDAMYDPGTSRFTPPTPGLYQFIATIVFTAGVPIGKRLIVYLYKNGVSYKAYTEATHDAATNICETIGLVEANGTDYFELYARHDTGVTTVTIGGANTRLQMMRVGALPP